MLVEYNYEGEYWKDSFNTLEEAKDYILSQRPSDAEWRVYDCDLRKNVFAASIV